MLWFVAVAPVASPRSLFPYLSSMAVMAGSTAAPLAKKAIEAYFLNKAKNNRATAAAMPQGRFVRKANPGIDKTMDPLLTDGS